MKVRLFSHLAKLGSVITVLYALMFLDIEGSSGVGAVNFIFLAFVWLIFVCTIVLPLVYYGFINKPKKS